MSKARAKTKDESFNEIVTIRIELADSDPLIWREVEAPTSITLKVLHDIIQIVMGWENYHLWMFTIAGRRYGPSGLSNMGDEPSTSAAKARLRDVLQPRKTTIDYLYDFGDSWEARLTVTKIREGLPDLSYPRYIGGKRNAPPEDCGGIPGFYAALEALADPAHPDHAERAEWFGDYDPENFEDLPIKYALGRIAIRRKAGRTRNQPKR